MKTEDAKLAVVVGAGAMGAAITRRLARHYRVLVADLDGERAEALAAQLREDGKSAFGLQCDVTNADSVAALARRVRGEGGLNALVQVAGLSPSMGDFDQILRVNLFGPSLVSSALLPEIRPGAAAIMIASLAAHMCSFGLPIEAVLREHASDYDLPERLRALIGGEQTTSNTAYQLSKFGLVMFCRRSAAQWGARGGRILSLSPGLIATPMGNLESASNPAKQKLFEMAPQKREGTMDEIADAVEFLLSDRAAFISGTDLLVDGGLAGTLTDVPFRAP